MTQMTPGRSPNGVRWIRSRLLSTNFRLIRLRTRASRTRFSEARIREHRRWSHSSIGLAQDIDAFYMEHRRCGDLDASVDGPIVWMAGDCGASMTRRAVEEEHADGQFLVIHPLV
jgi:hypothetical protein